MCIHRRPKNSGRTEIPADSVNAGVCFLSGESRLNLSGQTVGRLLSVLVHVKVAAEEEPCAFGGILRVAPRFFFIAVVELLAEP